MLTFEWTYTGTSEPTFYTQDSASGNTFYTASTNPYSVAIAEDQDAIILHNLNVTNITSFPNDRSWRNISINNFEGDNLTLKNIDFTKATSLNGSFNIYNISSNATIDLTGWKVSESIDMSGFQFPNANTLILDDWYFTNFSQLFYSKNKIKNVSLKNVNTSACTSCREAFCRASGITSIDLTSMDVSNVTDMWYMFYNAKGLTNVDISGWNMSKVETCDYMFYNCTNLQTLNAVGVKPPITTVTNPQSMFYGDDNFTLILGEVSQEYYDWWLTALQKSNVDDTVTIEYTIV